MFNEEFLEYDWQDMISRVRYVLAAQVCNLICVWYK